MACVCMNIYRVDGQWQYIKMRRERERERMTDSRILKGCMHVYVCDYGCI